MQNEIERVQSTGVLRSLRMMASHDLLILLADTVGKHFDAEHTEVGVRIGVPCKRIIDINMKCVYMRACSLDFDCLMGTGNTNSSHF